jgi:hypothetical protein
MRNTVQRHSSHNCARTIRKRLKDKAARPDKKAT